MDATRGLAHTHSDLSHLLTPVDHQVPQPSCSHIEAIVDVQRPASPVCEECLKIDSTWIHLRTCQECGRTHCCDSSPKRHASAHYEQTRHPVIASAEAGERWMYCYQDDAFSEY